MNKHNQNVLQISIGILVAGIVTGYIIMQQPERSDAPYVTEPLPVAYEPVTYNEESLPSDSDTGTLGGQRRQVFNYVNRGEVINFDSQEPTRIEDLSLFKPLYAGESLTWAKDHVTYYRVGVVTDGFYKDGELLLVTGPEEGMGGQPVYRFIRKAGQLILLGSHSDFYPEGNYLDENLLVVDNDSTLPQLTFPEQISYGNYTLSRRNSSFLWDANFLFTEYASSSPLQFIFKDSKLGDVFMDKPGATVDFPSRNGFYLKAADGTTRAYALDIPFYDSDRHIPAVTWQDGVSGDIEYTYADAGGCGAQNFSSVVESVTKNDLVVAGKTSNGDAVYLLKNVDHPILQEIYENDYRPYNEEKMSYTQFVAGRPAFFWFDPFNRLIKFQRMNLMPAVECGKPVIYLYPTEPTEINVTFDQAPLFSVDIPAYASGWKVLAHPDSRLTDLQPDATDCNTINATTRGSEYAENACTTGTYPYLYWAGKANGIYPTPLGGWVISNEELETFLELKLEEIGLNEQERTDMLSFWIPELLEKEAPYYRLSFFGTSQMDQFIPMKISPQPDSRLRIFLDWSPLTTLPQQLPPPQQLKPFTRSGFTLIEWGGLER